jgi:hypothetical protein
MTFGLCYIVWYIVVYCGFQGLFIRSKFKYLGNIFSSFCLYNSSSDFNILLNKVMGASVNSVLLKTHKRVA